MCVRTRAYRETLALLELRKTATKSTSSTLARCPELQNECFIATLFTAISRTGVLFMWPVGCRRPTAEPTNGTPRPPRLPSTP